LSRRGHIQSVGPHGGLAALYTIGSGQLFAEFDAHRDPLSSESELAPQFRASLIEIDGFDRKLPFY